MTKKLGIRYNEKGSYVIRIIKTGEVIEKFRVKGTALSMLSHYENIIMEELEVVEL